MLSLLTAKGIKLEGLKDLSEYFLIEDKEIEFKY